jgi:hypothetical protein
MIFRSMDASVDARRNTPAPVRDAGQHEIYPRLSASNFPVPTHSMGNSRGNKCPANASRSSPSDNKKPANRNARQTGQGVTRLRALSCLCRVGVRVPLGALRRPC